MADPEVDLFAGMKKKKKKQVTLDVEEPTPSTEVEAEPTPAAAAAPSPVVDATPTATDDTAPVDGDKPAEDGGDLFADMKKKKKKKKDIPLDLESAEPISVDGMDLKKKKSKKQTSDFAKELDEMDAEADGDDAVVDDGDLGDDIFAAAADGGADTGKEAWVIEGRDPTYPELLKRFFTLLHTHNPELAGEKRRYTIVPPQVAREGTKKTVFANLTDICRRMHRQPEHVIQFLYSELGTQGSIDGAQRLVMKGRYNQKQIENVLRKYIGQEHLPQFILFLPTLSHSSSRCRSLHISRADETRLPLVEYVTCKICKSPDTLLGKENRLYFMTCESCGSRRSVSAIKAGYQAQIGKRIKAP